jgi:hypothetical protein
LEFDHIIGGHGKIIESDGQPSWRPRSNRLGFEAGMRWIRSPMGSFLRLQDIAFLGEFFVDVAY